MAHNVGSLHLVIGPMKSGKTNELQRLINRSKAIGSKVMIVNHSSDTRYGDNAIISHSGNHIPACMVSSLKDIFEPEFCSVLTEADVIVVDEAQFFSDLLETVFCLVRVMKKKVIVGSLNGDSDKRLFGNVNELIAEADSITHLTALCQICASDNVPAPFTKVIPGVKKDGQTLVGSSDTYMSVCRYHSL